MDEQMKMFNILQKLKEAFPESENISLKIDDNEFCLKNSVDYQLEAAKKCLKDWDNPKTTTFLCTRCGGELIVVCVFNNDGEVNTGHCFIPKDNEREITISKAIALLKAMKIEIPFFLNDF